MTASLEGTIATNTAGPAVTSIVATKPAGTASGELGLIFVVADLTNAISDEFNTPIGWNKIVGYAPGGSCDTAVVAYWRALTGDSGDDAPTITWTTAAEALSWYSRWSGADTADPINGTSTPALVNSNVALAITGLTTDADDCLAFYIDSFDGGDGYPFSVAGTGWSETAEAQYNTAADTVSGCWGTKVQTTAGATGTATVTASLAGGHAGFQFAINPAPAGGGAENRAMTLLGVG